MEALKILKLRAILLLFFLQFKKEFTLNFKEKYSSNINFKIDD